MPQKRHWNCSVNHSNLQMRLTKLEISGFKSFAKRTELIFEPGITGILGPNGCGKSNISDAVRFVLGEQSARALRGKKVEDFIFGGTETRRPLSYCQVSMYFDNSDGTLASPYSEVMVTRHSYRSGESEYFINKAPCRLKDINELFRDTGIGKDGYSIIGQGRVSEILSDRSGDRREAFEEAAGVMKYRARKEEAERKLQNTAKNLTRLDDIINELKSRLDPLRSESEKAIEYFKYREELRDLEINLFLYQYDKSTERLQQLNENMEVMRSSIDEASIAEASAASDCSRIEEQERNLSASLSELSQQLISMSSDVEASAGREQLLTERKATLEAELKNQNALIERLNMQLVSDNSELTAVKVRFNDESLLYETLSRESEVREGKRSALAAEISDNEQLLEQHKQAMMNAMNSLADAKSHISRLEAMKSSIESRLASIEIERNELYSETRKLEIEQLEAKEEIKNIEEEKSELNSAYNAANELVRKLNQELSSDQSKQRSNENELNSINSRVRVLNELKRAHDGYYTSVKRLLNDSARNPRLASHIHGVLAELICVPAEYETAIEMALGSALQNIVVPTEQDAKEIIGYLRRNDYGRATLLPVSSMRPRLLNSTELDYTRIDGCFGIASELVEYDPKYSNVIENLLGRVVIVRDIDVGIAINRKAHSSFRIATLNGDLLNPGGSMTGGSTQKREVSLLGREREIEELNSRGQAVEQTISDILKHIESIKAKLAKANEAASSAYEKLRATDVKLASANEHSEIIIKYIKKNEESVAKLDSETEQLVDSRAAIEAQVTEALNEESGLSQGNAVTNKDIREVQITLSTLRDELQSENDSLSECKVKLMAAEKEMKAAKAGIERISSEISNKQESIAAAKTACENADRDIIKIEIELESLSDALMHQRAEFEALTQSQAALEAERTTKLTVLDEKRAERENIAQQLIDLRERQHRFELNLNRAQSELTALCDRIWQDYELTYENAQAFRRPIQATQSHMRADELRKLIKALGQVNTSSVEEYREVKERYDELTAQCNDLQQAEADLNELIAKLTATMEAEFSEQFALIQKNFSETFVALFGGGKAELVLSDKNDVLNCNIDIIAQPPGKKLQLLSLLSGGEQALTAIALLFAILKLKPAAFCILDEIDTSLDEANVDNFARYLQEYSSDTQFIIITHRKGAMAVCNALYGVSMEEKGVSTIVSAKFNQ